MKISVIIPVYNSEKWVSDAVTSVADEKYVGEVLLVEDGSTDESFSVCSELSKRIENVRLLRHKDDRNLGAGASRNLGIKNSRSELIAFLDADDICLPNRFDSPMKILRENETIDGVYEAIGTIFEDDKAKERWDSMGIGQLTTVHKAIEPEELFYYLVMWKAGHFHLNGLVIRKYLFYKVGGFNDGLRLHQDTDFCIKLTAVGNLVNGRLKKPVAMRRVHSGNRYVKKRKDALNTKILMWNSLVDWARRNRLSNSKKLILQYQLFRKLTFIYRKQKKWHLALFYFTVSRYMKVAVAILKKCGGTKAF